MILLENGVQIPAVGIHRLIEYPRQITEPPVRPDKAHRSPGNGAADQGINDARQCYFKAFPKQVETEQHQQSNKHGGVRVLHIAKRKKQHPGDHN